jgi:hypothetical protein
VREVEAPLPSGVACERTYQVIIDGQPQPLLCRWFVPTPHPQGSWDCRVELVWPDGRLQRVQSGGVDSAQALVLALESVHVRILSDDLPIHWFEEHDDLGLPYRDHLAEDLAERKARFDVRTRSHPLWPPVHATLSADWDPFVRSSVPEKYDPYVRELIGRLQKGETAERIAAFLCELRGYIDGSEAFESDAATDLVAAGKLRALVDDVR